jgi:hypothetical protein
MHVSLLQIHWRCGMITLAGSDSRRRRARLSCSASGDLHCGHLGALVVATPEV